jgi:hypothetical protein
LGSKNIIELSVLISFTIGGLILSKLLLLFQAYINSEKFTVDVLALYRYPVKFMGKFPARPSNKSRFLLWPCKIATSLFDPDFIFLPFHGPAVTFAVNSQLK